MEFIKRTLVIDEFILDGADYTKHEKLRRYNEYIMKFDIRSETRTLYIDDLLSKEIPDSNFPTIYIDSIDVERLLVVISIDSKLKDSNFLKNIDSCYLGLKYIEYSVYDNRVNKLVLFSRRDNMEELYRDEKRLDYISWDEYFMGIALLSSRRSKDPKTQVGSCIVRDNKILSIGYNGFPNNCSDNEFPWVEIANDKLDMKDFYVVHSELNAILNYKGDLSGSTIYVTLFPCNECAKAIIQSGIKKVIYKEYKKSQKSIAAKRMFSSAGVECKQYESSGKKEIIEL